MASKKSSKVWEYFEKVKDDPKKVKCKLCQQLLSYHTTTTNMAYHLKRLHPQFHDDSSGSTSASAAAPRLTQKKIDLRPPLSEKRKKEITEKIAEFVALDMRPVRIVEGEGFKELLRTLEPGYTVPTRATVMDVVHTKYLSIRSDIYMAIQDCEAVSFTTDIWTSLQMEAYLTVTSHFITGDWRLESFVLETKKMEDSHTADHIARELTEIICEWDIPSSKIVSVVHDNAANMVACTNQLVQQPRWGKMKGVRCAGHTLQLCINSALKQDPICRTVAAARRLVSYFKKSAKATTALQDQQKQQNVPQHKLVQDVVTRWNSVYLMLDRLIEQKGPVSAVLTNESVSKRRWELKGPGLEISVYISAAVLDPRFKKLSFLSDDQRDEAYSVVAELAESLTDRSCQEESDTVDPGPTAPKQDAVMAMLLASDEDEEEQDETSEMKVYLKDFTKCNGGPLEWWKKNKDRYPKLSRVAKRFHSIPSTSTPSERIFSKAGFIANKSRSALFPTNVNKLVFLAHNFRRIRQPQVL
ncbi:zinc finger BED domain-containing protein 4-like [Clarias gariepinus]|uniref:zinc finger BED domain-containing protein 4-like n=1 Tax=Clarias gariepinus TaxID=13013 RepID=UPI00234CE103|nr:zinc finger BED domain-containing protein 4-like [Clarias gariepinus]